MDKFSEIKKLFEANQDNENAIAMSKYMRNLFPFYGIKAPLRKEICKNFLKEEKKAGQIDWAFLDKCYQDEHREFQYLANDYLIALHNQLSYRDISKTKKYIQTKSWWDTIDFLDQVVGDIGLRDQRVDSLMLKWSADKDFWVRRIAIDHQLGRKEKTNTELLEKIILNNFGSDEFFINKAIGWSLRDYSKTNPKWVKAFVDTHRDEMSPLSLREASKYIN